MLNFRGGGGMFAVDYHDFFCYNRGWVVLSEKGWDVENFMVCWTI